MITIHQRYRQTDRQTTCDRNTALCTKVHRAVKTKDDPLHCSSNSMIIVVMGTGIVLMWVGIKWMFTELGICWWDRVDVNEYTGMGWEWGQFIPCHSLHDGSSVAGLLLSRLMMSSTWRPRHDVCPQLGVIMLLLYQQCRIIVSVAPWFTAALYQWT